MLKSARTIDGWLAASLMVGLLAAHFWWATRGWTVPGLSGHEFRQTQTAISIREMIRDGQFRIDYATPILGKPWSLPMEFPTYQYVVAKICRATGLGLVPVARGVSLACFYVGLPALFLLLRRMGCSRTASVLALAPVMGAPVYLLYSRTVMIEAMAWAASAWFLWGVVQYRDRRRPGWLVFALLAGVLAVLTKATTWAVFSAPWGGLMLRDLWGAVRGKDRRRLLGVIDEGVLLVVPLLLVGFGWVWIADRIKEMNPIAAFLTSHNLRAFNFGTWVQRMEIGTWKAIWSHLEAAVMPGWAMGVSLVAAVVALARGWSLVVLTGLGFLAGPLVFTNLYAIHDYYFYANGLFLAAWAGVAAAKFWDHERHSAWWRAVALAVVGVIGFGEVSSYRANFFPLQTDFNSGQFGFTEALHDLTGPDDVIVMQSPDWGAIIPYRVDRRMLIIPDSEMFYHEPAVRQAIGLLRDEKVELVVFRGQSLAHGDWLLQRIRDFDLEPFPLFTVGNDLEVFANKHSYAAMQAKLRAGHYDQIKVEDPALLGPIVPLGTPESVAGATNMDPLPFSGSLPFGASLRWNNGVQYFFAHSPTELSFRIPTGAKVVDLGYVMDLGVYEHSDFDGINLRLEVRAGDKLVRVVQEEFITPDGTRAPRHLVLPLRAGEGDTVVLRVLPGPRGSNAFDWALLEYLRIH